MGVCLCNDSTNRRKVKGEKEKEKERDKEEVVKKESEGEEEEELKREKEREEELKKEKEREEELKREKEREEELKKEKEREEELKREKEREEELKKEREREEELKREKEREEALKKEREREEELKREKEREEALKKEREKEELLKIQKLELEKKYEEFKKEFNNFYNDFMVQENYITNFKLFLSELNDDINEIKTNIHLSLCNFGSIQDNNISNQNITNLFSKDLDEISNKILTYSEMIEEIKNNKIKKIENIYDIIQQNFNEIENMKKADNLFSLNIILEKNNKIISDNLSELKTIFEQLKIDKTNYDSIRKIIETKIKDIQNKAIKFQDTAEFIQSSVINTAYRLTKVDKKIEPKVDKKYLKNSMLLDIQDFRNPREIFSTKILFDNSIINKENYQKQNLLRNNWNETCYIYDDYDIYDVNFVLLAVGLPENVFYSRASIGFTLNRQIEILEFEIDGKKAEYNNKDYSLEFNIHLCNLESNKIHYKIKQSKKNLTKGEIKERKFYRSDYYGLSKNVKGVAKFTLIIKCDFEIINFEDEFFVKTNEKEYTWGGEVPSEGKKTVIKLSKTKAYFDFKVKQRIESIAFKPLKNTKLSFPKCFEGGNNNVRQIKYLSHQTEQIEYDDKKEVYEINFVNSKTNYGEFIVEGQFINACKGEWSCDYTNEQIEANIPEDFKRNKSKFKEISKKIIEEYDKIHKNDLIQVTDFVKIGKWVHKNIKYDISYKGKNDITAVETYNKRVGVCHHFTKLYNALMYSLGYQCIYVSGYAIKSNDCFNKDDGHAWSLIKVNNKWLPFDATWGIFSGKLPVCHIFYSYFSKTVRTHGTDSINIVEKQIKGHFLK